MSCATTNFTALKFGETYVKHNAVIRLSKHYHLQLDPYLVHGKCEIIQIPFEFVACAKMLAKPWDLGVDHDQQ